MSPPPKTRVVVLGGGPAAAAAAFWLTSSPELRAQYDVSIYTRGWRLGGKCASGRNAALGSRIEEHGLHILMGCYRNAFRTIRACYQEWQPPAGSAFRAWTDAFTAERRITLEERDGGGTPPGWAPWSFDFPRYPGQPGADVPAAAAALAAHEAHAPGNGGTEPPVRAEAGISMPEMVVRMADRLETWLPDHVPPDVLGNYREAITDLRRAARHPLVTNLAVATTSVENLAERIRRRMAPAAQGRPNTTGERIRAAVARVRPSPRRSEAWAAGALRTLLAPVMGPLVCLLGRFGGRGVNRALILADLALSVAIGLLRDVLPHANPDYTALNHLDFRQWLRSCGATPASVDSAPVRALYDLTFAYIGGDAATLDNGSMAAGVTLRFVLEATLGYQNAPLWRMNAGMGDAVFMPFYDVLTARGVRINLFHRLTDLQLTPDDSKVGTIRLDRQADFTGADYQPFVEVANLRCWPNQPDWTQLANGAALAASGVNFESSWDTTVSHNVALQLGTDFDLVVLAVPPEVVRRVAPQLASAETRWQAMLAHSASVPTQAFQLWTYPSLAELGWRGGPTVLTAYAEPFDSWADMSHLLAREVWPAPNPPRAIGYFCGCLAVPVVAPPAPDPIPAMTAVVAANAQTWLAGSIATLWPALPAGGALGPAMLAGAFYRANVDLSELYVQTPAGSVQYRLPSGQRQFGNLHVAGDWTLTRFSGGCFESAIESGMLAAAAICGHPTGIVA